MNRGTSLFWRRFKIYRINANLLLETEGALTTYVYKNQNNLGTYINQLESQHNTFTTTIIPQKYKPQLSKVENKINK